MPPAVVLAVAALTGLLVGAAIVLVAPRRRSGAVPAAAPTVDVVEQAVRAVAAESDARLRAAIESLSALTGERLRDQAAAAGRELDLHDQAFTRQVGEVRSELVRLTGLVAELQQQRAEQQGSLVRAIDEAARRSGELERTTAGLRDALVSSRARGQWGERMADDVLRAAGLVEHVNYRTQVTLPGGGRPDVTFLLPRDRVLHLDVKFPVDNYLRHLEATTDAERAASEQAFLRDVRARVRELAGRDYVDPASTVGYVLLFIPNEAIYAFVHERDPQLLDVALGQRVVLCSPLSLYAVLAVVRQAVDTFALEQTTDEILECLTGFEKQWRSFTEVLDRLGNQLGTAQRTYDALSGTRRRQLERQLDEVARLRTARPTLEVVDGIDDPDDGEVDCDGDGDVAGAPATAFGGPGGAR